MTVTNHELEGVVREGKVILPEKMVLPDGTRVRVIWQDGETVRPYDREPVAENDVQADLDWANGKRFPR